MTLPANLRVNTQVPFPSLVTGSGAIGITKQNGIWQVTLNYGSLAVQAPTPPQQANDYVAVWDSVLNTYFRFPLSSMTGATGGMQRSVTAGPVTVQTTDQTLNLNLPAPTTIPLPSYTTRNGIPLRFKDVGLHAAANPITINAAAGEFIDGVFTSVVMNINGQAIELFPFNDGVNAGWAR